MEINSAECVNAIVVPEPVCNNLVTSEAPVSILFPGKLSNNFLLVSLNNTLPEMLETANNKAVDGNTNQTNSFAPLAMAHEDTAAIVYPEDAFVATDLNSCHALVTSGLSLRDPENIISTLRWQMEGATNARSPGSGINQLTSYVFNEGTTVVTYQGKTRNNKLIYHTFTVTVRDNQIPRLIYSPGNITVSNSAGKCYARVNWTEPIVSDNCVAGKNLIIQSSHASGDDFLVGETEVEYRISDGENETIHRFTVSVVDREAPELKAPEPIVIVCGEEVEDAFTSWKQFEQAGGKVSDNCAVDFESFRYVRQIASDIRCPYNITRTYSIADVNGNVSEVKRYIQITGEEPQKIQEEQAKTDATLKSGMATIISTAVGGDWNNPATWQGGVVPGIGDNVEIQSGATVTINNNQACDNLLINGNLNVSGTEILQINGSWTNNGSFDPDNGTVEFTGSGSANIGGSAVSTPFKNFILNKGSLNDVLQVNCDIVLDGDITFTSGKLQINTDADVTCSGNSGFLVDTSAGLYINGGSFTGGPFSVTFKGLFQIDNGIATFGGVSGNSVLTQNSGTFDVNGGIVNVAGRLEVSGGDLNISGAGTVVNLNTVGQNSSSMATLDLSVTSDFNMTGGTINFLNPNGSGYFDVLIENTSGTKNISGGTFKFGDGISDTYKVSTAIDIPNITTDSQTELEITRIIDANGTYTFNLSDGNGNKIPVEISITADSYASNASIKVTTTDERFTDNRSSANYLSRYWTADLTGVTNPVYNLSADYRSTDIVGIESEIAAGAWDGSAWTKGNVAGGNTITFNDLTGDVNITGITADAPTVIAGVNSPVCEGDGINLSANPSGDAPFTYAWTGPNGFTSDQQNPIRTNLSAADAGTYSVAINDANGFPANDDVSVTVNTLPTFTTCPSTSIPLNTFVGTCAAIANYTVEATGTPEPVLTYSFSGTTTGSGNGTGSGSSFNLGTTNVTVTATNSCGSVDCVFDVVVSDNEDPVWVTTVDNLNQTLECSDVVALAAAQALEPIASDNCGSVTLSKIPGSFVVGSCPNAGTYTNTWIATDASGNSSSNFIQIITVKDTEVPVLAAAPVDITIECVADLPAETDLTWTDNCDAGGSVTSVTTALVGGACGGTYTRTWNVSDACGNAAETRTQIITVNDTEAPVLAAAPADITIECVADLPAETALTWTDNCDAGGSVTSVTTALIGGACGGTYTRTWNVSDACGNAAETRTHIITVKDTEVPVLAAAPADITIECVADLPAETDLTWTDNCDAGGSVTSVTTALVGGACGGTYTRTWNVSDACGNAAETRTQIITVNDTEAPTASNPLSIDVECAADVPAQDIAVVTDEADNCTANPVVAHVSDLSDGGFNPEVIIRTYSITDDCGNSINVEQTITIDDITPPDAQCRPITIQLDATGNASITTVDINNGSNDNCTADVDLVLTLDKTAFTCDDLGSNTVTLTVTDEEGNSSTCAAIVTVEDNVAPVAVCQDITVQLDATGNATITAADIDNGSTDNCAITSRTLSQNNFDCDDVGENTVTLTITDVNGNSSTCDAKVSVEQIILPTALCKDITVELDASGNATITAGDIDNGSIVVCGTPTLSIDQSTFNCNDVGTQTVTLTVSDQNGNSSQCTATVTVQDNILPTVVCKDIAVALDASGAATITAADIDNGSSDNCSIASLVLDKTSFDCSEAGDHTVTLTVTDEHGNSNFCTANVEIIDDINPTAICRDLTIQLNSSGTAVIAASDINNGSTDNCSIASVTINQTIFDCTDVGTNTVTLTVTDASGNSATCEGIVTIEDKTNPIAICKNYTVQLDATGNASITAADIDNGSNDACGIASLDLDRYDFTCADLGTNAVTLTVTDNNGNQSSCPAVVTVTDNLPPTASAGGSATICIDETHTVSGANANNGTIKWTHDGNGTLTDINSLTPSYTSVLADAGNPVTLTLTVTGNNACGNNTATASYLINVNSIATVNSIAPMEYCEGETTPDVELNSNQGAAVTFNIAGGQDIGLFNRNNVTEIPSFTAVAGTRTITITPVYDGCPGEPLDVEITVNPTPGVSASPLSQTICSGEETDILLGSNLAGSTFYWTTTVSPAGSVSGMTDGVDESTTTIAQTLTNNTASEATVTYRIYAKNGDCTGAAMDVIVKVKPGITATIAGTTTVCQEDPEPNITFTVNGGTAPYIFTYTINGGANQDVQLNSGNTIDVPVPTDTDGDFIYNLVSVYESGGCTQPFNETATVTVSPKPYLINTPPAGICSNDIFNYIPESTVANTSFKWSRNAMPGVLINPAVVDQPGNIDEQLELEPSIKAPTPVEYLFELVAEGCTTQQVIVVMVTPAPTLTNIPVDTGVCSESMFTYSPESDVTGTTFEWTRAYKEGISNPARTETGDINEVLINTTNNPINVTYTYTLSSNNCENPTTYSFTVLVTPAPDVWAKESNDLTCVCPGGSISLSSGSDIAGSPLEPNLWTENFESIVSVQPENNSSGGTVSNANWTIQESGTYKFTPGYWDGSWQFVGPPNWFEYIYSWVDEAEVTFNSNDNSQFYLSNSHAQGIDRNNDYTTETYFTSPAINTIGYTSLELDFYHYFRKGDGDVAIVQVSTDNASWIDIRTFNSTQGGSSNFDHETIDLSTYTNEESLYIRFRYEATEDYYWAIDNINLTGESTGTTADVSWESIPAGFTSNEANPSNVTITDTTQFVVTYVDPDTNCPGRDTVTVNTCETPEPIIAPDYCAYEGEVLLTAYGGEDGATFVWTDSNGDVVGTDQELIVDIVDVYTVTITNPNGCSATTQLTVSNELIINGDFEAGNTGFSSDYGFVEPYLNSPPSDAPGDGTPESSLWPEGLYGVGTNARFYHTNFWGREDHTSGSGNFMIVNGNVNAGTPIWEQTVNVQPNTNYYFSAWAMSLNDAGNDAVLQFEVNGVLVGSLARLNPGVGDNSNNGWVRFYSEPNWNSGSVSGPITVRIRNVEPAAGGNDFALDDISFGTFDPFPLEINVDFDEVCEGETLFLYSNSQYGKEPITYSWTGPNGWTSTEQNPSIPNFSLANAGTYRLEALDGYGCEILPGEVDVPFNEAATVDAGPDDFVCTANPVVVLNGSRGGSATSVTWTGGGGGTFDDITKPDAVYTLSQAEIDAGTTTLTLTTNVPSAVCDAVSDDVVITIYNSLEITTSSTMPDCHGGANGTATATVSVPTVEPYTYLWSDGQTTAIARNLTVGTYSVTVTDANGCTAQASVTVNEPDLFVISAISPIVVAPSCYGATDGSATMEVTGGTPPYSFIWDAATGDQRTATASNLAAGTYTVLVTDANGCSAATFNATIPNPPPPTLLCPDDVEDFVDPASCTISFSDIEDPLMDGYCTTTLTYELSGATTGSGTGSVNGIDFNVGLTTVKYKIEDTVGNKDSCTFTVFAKHLDLSPTVYTCPLDNVNAGAPDTYVCYKTVSLDAVELDDDCNEIESIWHDSPYSSDPGDASGDYPVGTTNFTWYIRDVSGNIETCDVTVIVDDLDPKISCPGNVSETVAANECSKTGVTIGSPTYNDNCPNPELSYVLSGATTGSGTNEVPSYQVFNIGVTTVTYTVIDANNNKAECSFTVTIERLSIPPAVITCPDSPDPVTAVAGTCFAPVNVDAPVISDPCATTSYAIVNDFNNTGDASGSYPVGTTIVTWTITDNSGKTYTCEQEVVVEDIPPTIDCPESDTFLADENVDYKDNVTLDDPTYADNCPNPIVEWTRVEPDGTTNHSSSSGINFIPNPGRYYIGVTTITYKITDSSGLTDECSFTVTVTGIPEIDCPDDIPLPTDAGVCTRALDPGVPVLEPGSPSADSWSWEMTGATTGSGSNTGSTPDPISPNPYTFNVGETTITWTVCNASGCATCSQVVEVTDTIPPDFATQPYTACVEPILWAIYNPSNPNPVSGVDPNLEISPSPDYSLFEIGNTSMDLLSLEDNCCDSVDMTIYWRIEFSDTPDPLNPTGPYLTHSDIEGTGQPSTYINPVTGFAKDIELWGDGVFFSEVVHHIFYWVEDCNGNISKTKDEEIKITPRPEIIKTNY